MDRIEYSSSTDSHSWSVPPTSYPGYTKVTHGLWTRKTKDVPLQVPLNASTHTNQYAHEPLQPGQIRVLSLEPGLPQEPLKGSLSAVSMDGSCASSSYDALSYCWGDSWFTADIDLGNGGWRISENLAIALAHLRSPTETSVLWIDAICINQDDVKERGTQVSMMQDIYAGAERVVAWLGLSTEYSSTGMEVLTGFSKGERFNEKSTWWSLPEDEVVAGLSDIVSRSWFERYWVIQEGALAKEMIMMCGNDTFSWPNTCSTVLSFARAIKLAVISPQWQSTKLKDIDMDVMIGLLQMQLESGPESNTWARRSKGPDVLEFAYNMRQRRTTDLRDRIWALIGLAKPTNTRRGMTPNYALSAEEAFEQFAEVAMEETEHRCRELDSLRRSGDAQQTHHRDASTVVETEGPDCSAPGLEGFIEHTCASALDDLRNGNPKKAAQLFESAAMMLRGESFKSAS